MLIEAYSKIENPGLTAILGTQLSCGTLLIIDLAPLVLSFAGILIGKSLDRQREALARLDLRVDRATSDLILANQWMRRTCDTLSESLIHVGEDGTIDYANAATANLLGYSQMEIPGMPIADIIPEWKSSFLDIVPQDLEIDYLMKNGDRRPMSLTGKKLHSSRDASILFLCVANDLSGSKQAETRFAQLYNQSRDAIMVLDPKTMEFVSCNDSSTLLFGAKSHLELLKASIADLMPEFQPDGSSSQDVALRKIEQAIQEDRSSFEWRLKTLHGEIIESRVRLERLEVDGYNLIQGTIQDRTQEIASEREKSSMEVQLRHAQKLEAVGQLAAGIAHEVNTPMQFVGDNTRFLQEAFEDMDPLMEIVSSLADQVTSEEPFGAPVSSLKEAVEKADLGYLRQEIPHAIAQSLEGIDRVTTIVKAMKEFSHPGCEQMTNTDINAAIQSTVTVARNEWKYVAELETDYDSQLPPVCCISGEINQVILNLIINASHAIGDVVSNETNKLGTISISTRRDGKFAEIRIRDTGAGIPDHVQDKIFEPLFTTKDVGKGTGQGLCIAHTVVVQKHGGTLEFETSKNEGTVFIIRLPFEQRAKADASGEVDQLSYALK